MEMRATQVSVPEVSPVPHAGGAFDILLIDPDQQRSLFTLRAISDTMRVRCARRTSGRSAWDSFRRARFNAIICRTDCGDVISRHWIRAIRTGRFGYALTPVVVLCDEVELKELAPMVDEHTTLVRDDDPDALTFTLQAIEVGTEKPTVLIVEDEILAAQAAAAALEKFYRVEIACDGESALKVWREKHHQLVLLDLMLPGISGLETLSAMMAERPEQVVIVLTALDAPEKHQELVLAGASDFVSKGVDMHTLPELCAGALRARQCIRNVEKSRAEATHMAELAARVRAANYHFERGQSAHGTAHLRRALLATSAHLPDDDEWTRLLAEFDRS